MFPERLADAWGHEEVEGRDRLPAVLLILVGLEYDGGQGGVALDALGGAHRAVLGVESPLEEVLQVVL